MAASGSTHMFDNYQICPYTGLRSFTEEEAIYFKGRENDIDLATGQLHRNKFLMLTGASGDGKSSLVYAGVIPNARAGFLKSKFTSWAVAGFRPERDPFGNLCRAVATQLEIENPETVKAELSHGFSALIDLYKNSKRYVDTDSVSWNMASDKEKTAMKRDASNLVLLVDQFEEFFTNPENYLHGAPSKDASLVVNLLLETARISLEEDLPVYVIFTMRSDYVGQCADFRGLPEYIGFSQFFVPRLNRSQLQQVIEEPAELSGNRITRRLTERLIHDLTEGVDQLPILQHALNQIWVAANNGNEEMDLIHYAMVGGMSESELVEEQAARFHQWFEALPPKIKSCYHTPSLQNVLDTHTNKLYEQAAGYFKEKTGTNISNEEAKALIRTTFTCLTKIDKGRAVRNRMTLEEITQIFGKKGFDAKKVGGLLNIFREPGNTFIHPFIYEEYPESRELQGDQVLDITHESLIRNWQWLGQWAEEEYNSHTISQDFEKQLNRWVESGKSDNFLLSIGQLTYFENWFNKADLNAWHVARYLSHESEPSVRFAAAGRFLGNSREFLERSASKHVITRTLMRYGARRVAAVLGIIALITLTSFGIRDYLRKQNGAVLNDFDARIKTALNNNKVPTIQKVENVVEQLKAGRTTFGEVAASISDPVQKVSLVHFTTSLITFTGMGEPRQEILKGLRMTDSLLSTFSFPVNDPAQLDKILLVINDFRVTLELDYVYNADPAIDSLIRRNAAREADWVMRIVQQPESCTNIMEFEIALENALNYQKLDKPQIEKLLSFLSPFEHEKASPWVEKNFQQDILNVRGELGYGFFFNALYQEVAYLYAASGNEAKALQCVDSLMKYSQANFQRDYSQGIDNASNIACVFASYGNTQQLDAFVNGYCKRKGITDIEFYQRLLGRSLRERSTQSNLNLLWWQGAKANLNLKYARIEQLAFFYEKWREVIKKSNRSADEKNFLLALSYKGEGIQRSVTNESAADKNQDKYFDEAIRYYEMVGPAYLSQSVQMNGTGSAEESVTIMKAQFVNPDYRTPFHFGEVRSFLYYYFSDCFMDYIFRKGLFEKLYPGEVEWREIYTWLSNYNTVRFYPPGFYATTIRYDVLRQIEQEYAKTSQSQTPELNLLYLHLGTQAKERKDSAAMLNYFTKINPDKLPDLLRRVEFGGNSNSATVTKAAIAVEELFKAGNRQKAVEIIRAFKSPINRSSMYAYAAMKLQYEKYEGSLVQEMIDSSRSEMRRITNLTSEQPNRQFLSEALTLQSPEKNKAEIARLIRNLSQKSSAYQSLAKARAFRGELYDATQQIPPLQADADLADFIYMMYSKYTMTKSMVHPEWAPYDKYYRPQTTDGLIYVDETN